VRRAFKRGVSGRQEAATKRRFPFVGSTDGARDGRDSKGRKKKIKEVEATQI